MKRSPIYPLQPTLADRPPIRTVTLQRGPAGLVMVSTVGKRQAAYVVKEIPAHAMGGRGFTLNKLFGGSDAEATGYAVFIADEGTAHQCHCKGFLRHNHCTHCDGLRELISAGELPPQLTPTPVIPVSAQVKDANADPLGNTGDNAGKVRVITSGVVRFLNPAAGTYVNGLTWVGPAKDTGNALTNQTLESVASLAQATGIVVNGGGVNPSFIDVLIYSRRLPIGPTA